MLPFLRGRLVFARLKRFRDDFPCSLDEEFHLVFRLFQLAAAISGEFHSFLEQFEGALEGEVALFEFLHDLFQPFEPFLEAQLGLRPRGFDRRASLRFGVGLLHPSSTVSTNEYDTSTSNKSGARSAYWFPFPATVK